MSSESHRRFLERAALREAQKAIDRQGRDAFRKEDFGRTRIQTIEPWKRLALAFFGVPFGVAGYFVLQEDVLWLALAFFIVGTLCVFASVIGRKKTVIAALDGIDLFTLLDALFCL